MNKKYKRRNVTIILLILLIIILLCIGYWYLHKPDETPEPFFDPNSIDWQGEQELMKEKMDSENINIPCFEKLVFSKGETSQQVNIYNPETNPCYMVASLIIEEETLWQSKMIEPDKGFYTIELNHALEAGEYNAYMLYQFYATEDLAEYNSAKILIDLVVQ